MTPCDPNAPPADAAPDDRAHDPSPPSQTNAAGDVRFILQRSRRLITSSAAHAEAGALPDAESLARVADRLSAAVHKLADAHRAAETLHEPGQAEADGLAAAMITRFEQLRAALDANAKDELYDAGWTDPGCD